MPKNTELEKIPQSNTHVMRTWSFEDKEKHFKNLDKAVKAFKKSFLDIALNLYWLDDTGCCNNKYLSVDGKRVFYKNIAEFASDRYGISKATTYQYIAIVKKFGRINPDTGFIDKLDDKYKDYNSTALIIMSGMDDMHLMFCKPTMKIRELKELCSAKNAIEDKSKDSAQKSDTAPPEPKDDKPEKEKPQIPEPKPKPPENWNSQRLFEIRDIKDFEERSAGIVDAIKKTLSQNNGKRYHVDILMTWDD